MFTTSPTGRSLGNISLKPEVTTLFPIFTFAFFCTSLIKYRSPSSQRKIPVDPDGLIRTLSLKLTSLINCTMAAFSPTIVVFPIMPLGVITGAFSAIPDSRPMSIYNDDDKYGEALIFITLAGKTVILLSRSKSNNSSSLLFSSNR